MDNSEKSETTNNIFERDLFYPAALILIMISLISATQEYFVFFKGIHTSVNFLLHLISKLIYFFYFIPLGLLLKYYSSHFVFSRNDFYKWIAVHFATLIPVIYLHQLLSYTTDRVIFSGTYKSTFYMVLYTNPAVWADIIIYVLCLLGFSLINSKKKSRENEIHCSKLEMELIKTKLFELRSKIHPQFLFNTLNTMSRLLESNQNKEANKMLSRLSEFLRTTVYDSERDEITLEEEWNFLNQYLEVEIINFSGKIFIDKIYDSQIKDSLVPNFFLQPIVEAFLNEKVNENNSSFEMIFYFQRISDQLHIELRFAHSGFTASEFQKDSKIINMIRDRLLQLYGNKYSVQLYSELKNQSIIKIIFPYHETICEVQTVYQAKD